MAAGRSGQKCAGRYPAGFAKEGLPQWPIPTRFPRLQTFLLLLTLLPLPLLQTRALPRYWSSGWARPCPPMRRPSRASRCGSPSRTRWTRKSAAALAPGCRTPAPAGWTAGQTPPTGAWRWCCCSTSSAATPGAASRRALPVMPRRWPWRCKRRTTATGRPWRRWHGFFWRCRWSMPKTLPCRRAAWRCSRSWLRRPRPRRNRCSPVRWNLRTNTSRSLPALAAFRSATRRNAALGRTSTAEEAAFVAQPGTGF